MDPVDFGHAMADALSEPGDGPEELATPTTESVIVDGRWEEVRETDDPLVNVRSLPDGWESVPTDPQGIIYRSDSAWHCPRCGAALDVAAPFPSDG